MAKQPTHAEIVLDRYREIGRRAEDTGNRLLQQGRSKEAVRVLTEAQRDLRDLKREVTDAERQLRLEATAARQKATSASQTSALFGRTIKKAVASGAAAQKNEISKQQTRILAEYAPVKSAIDQLVADLTRMKDDIRQGELDAAEDALDGPPSPPPPPVTDIPAQWGKDPSGVHEVRWWDGFRWTEHVSDGSIQAIDPLR